MSMVNEVAVFTTVLDDEIFVLPQGARSVDLINTGGATAYYKGNTEKAGKVSDFVSLATNLAYSFGDLNKPYPEITIDARGTIVDLTANY